MNKQDLMRFFLAVAIVALGIVALLVIICLQAS